MDEFDPQARRAARRRDHLGAIGICEGHNDYPCLGVTMSETTNPTPPNVVAWVHYDNSPETKQRMERFYDLLYELLMKRRATLKEKTDG
jgi:hypothetical protein